jgi:hypothetical protein
MLTHSEQAQLHRYGLEDIATGLALVEQHRTDDDDEEDPMTTYTEDELQACVDEMLDKLDDVEELPAFRAQMGKAIEAICDDVALQQLSGRQLRGQVGSMQKAIAAVYQDGRANRRAVRGLAQAFDKLCAGLLALERRTPPSPLTKAVASYLQPGDSLRKAQDVAAWVVRSFGRKGGQVVAYTREGAARLRLCKALTIDEEQRWRDFGRLPDHVDLQNPRPQAPVVQAQAVSLQVQHALASLGVSPLVFPALARRG